MKTNKPEKPDATIPNEVFPDWTVVKGKVPFEDHTVVKNWHKKYTFDEMLQFDQEKYCAISFGSGAQANQAFLIFANEKHSVDEAFMAESNKY